MSGQRTHASGLVSNTFIELNQKLKKLGIDDSVTLPQICVVGDQSSGKSSLVESISAIKVPRDSDCCTRCPLQINLLGVVTTQWRCDISLIENYRYDKNPKLKRPSRDRPLGPWCKLETTKTTLFTSTQDQDSVCDLIQRAQLAILNPSVDSTSYLGGNGLQKKLEVDFSPNVIRLEIYGAATPKLSFTDLPGIIENTAERSNEYLIDLVKALVAQYVAQTHSINLLTLPMTTDIRTSSSMRIVQQHDAEARTFLVMTKPDMVNDKGHRKQFLDQLTDTNAKMASHMVRMQQDPSIALAASLEIEENYFKTSAWVHQSREFKSKLGIPNLVDRLRAVLQTKTRDCLPNIESSIEQRLRDIEVQLDGLPEPPDVQLLPNILISLVQKFGERMQKLFLGGGNVDEFQFLSRWECLAQVLDRAIAQAWPRLAISTEADQTKMRKARAMIAKNVARSKPSRGQRPEAALDISDNSDVDDTTIVPKSEAKPIQSTRQQPPHMSFTLTGIRKLNAKHATPGLPRQIFPMAVQEMQILSLSSWDRPLRDFVAHTSQLIQNEIDVHVRQVFRNYAHLPIVKEASESVFNAVAKGFNEQESIVDMLLDVEKTKPYTRNGTALDREMKKTLSLVMQKRQSYRIELEQAIRDAANSADPKVKNKDKVTEVDLEEDEWVTEIEMLAKVRSYYFIASTRFVDNVCQNISARLFSTYARDLSAYLMQDLAPMDPKKHGQIAEMMTEDPRRLLQRKQLLEEKEKLLEAQKLVGEVLGDHDNKVDEPVQPVMPATPLKKQRTAVKRANDDGMDIGRQEDATEIDETPFSKRVRFEFARTNLNRDRGAENAVDLIE